MAKEDILSMSQKELSRLHIINKVLDRNLKQKDGAKICALSVRQLRRLINKVKLEGAIGICHKSRGKSSNRSFDEKFKQKVIRLYREKYWDFGPTLASEKLLELDNIRLSDETLRIWLLSSGDWKKSRKGRKHRKWRLRKANFGEMLQGDGSHHAWFEDRGAECVLMGYIDDANGEVFARFYKYEGTIPAMDSFKKYIERYGIPQNLYMDNHLTYKSPAKLTIEEELAGKKQPQSQFERAVEELGVNFIHAQSAPAKGRIERLFKTFQDRLIKEMRLAGVSSISEGNKFLKRYLPKYNARFKVEARGKLDLHRELDKNLDLDMVLCIKTKRVLRNDFTVSYNNKLYQVLERTRAKKVVVQERVTGRICISYKDKILKSKHILKSSLDRKDVKVSDRIIKVRPIPSKNHPWRRKCLGNYTPNTKRSQKQKELLLAS